MSVALDALRSEYHIAVPENDDTSVLEEELLDLEARIDDLEHKELAEGSESMTDSYYLPHHGVYRPDKSSTRLRVVFNASTATTSGLSLNDILLKRRIPQQELFSITARFRKHRYAFTADV
ncbi:uncharacterized protein LOC118199865 [Stegodyphus dumicola]|uniref:uncharacterized protein LOC118199865 n=1 Tax=Stegodyphus dumicola TaxID=202533 RepID=UPI0015AF1AD0|nr:uncharacterized protein LOC118199865 [Stegodyphus dumicola]